MARFESSFPKSGRKLCLNKDAIAPESSVFSPPGQGDYVLPEPQARVNGCCDRCSDRTTPLRPEASRDGRGVLRVLTGGIMVHTTCMTRKCIKNLNLLVYLETEGHIVHISDLLPHLQC